MARIQPSSDMAAFREHFAKSSHIVVLTGAGVSAESGVPTFRGAGGVWRKYPTQKLSCPKTFNKNPSLVWEFYHWRRELMLAKHPNPAHIAIAECEKRLAAQGRRLVVITQNIDELHKRAGSENIIELHGNLFKTRCTKCHDVRENKEIPICPALEGKGAPDVDMPDAHIPESHLPHCTQPDCGGLLRPHVVWFGELLDSEVLKQTEYELGACDLCLVVGTSSIVYPANMFAPQVATRGIPVAEFNLEATAATKSFGDIECQNDGVVFENGRAGETVPVALAPHESETSQLQSNLTCQ